MDRISDDKEVSQALQIIKEVVEQEVPAKLQEAKENGSHNNNTLAADIINEYITDLKSKSVSD